MFKLLLAIVVAVGSVAGASSHLRRAQEGEWLGIGGTAFGMDICGNRDVCYDYFYGDVIMYQPNPPGHSCAEFTYDLEYFEKYKKEDGLTHTGKVVMTTGCVPYDGRPDGCVAFLDDEQCAECSLCGDVGIQVNCSNVDGGKDHSDRCQDKWGTSGFKVLKLF